MARSRTKGIGRVLGVGKQGGIRLDWWDRQVSQWIVVSSQYDEGLPAGCCAMGSVVLSMMSWVTSRSETQWCVAVLTLTLLNEALVGAGGIPSHVHDVMNDRRF